jgi:hypothetical protein
VSNNLTDYYTTLRDRNLDKAPTPFDIRQTFRTFWTYELPVGKGKRLAVSNGVLDRVVGGWSLAGITQWNSGTVYKLTGGYSTFTGFPDATSDSGVELTGISLSQLQNQLRQFSPGPSQDLYSAAASLIGPDGRANPAFLSPASTPGVLGQFLYIYGPHLITTDMALRKEARIRERLRFNFQAEFLNVSTIRYSPRELEVFNRHRSARRRRRRWARAIFSYARSSRGSSQRRLWHLPDRQSIMEEPCPFE